MVSPVEIAELLQVGFVDFVSADEIKVLLNLDSPHDVALNAGSPRPFPRVNNYLIIPEESGFLVAQIMWVVEERAVKNYGDSSIVNLPKPQRKLSLVPVGVLKESIDEKGTINYSFKRGIEIYPTVGDPVLVPTQNQLRAIIESTQKHTIVIGESPIADNMPISVNIDKLYGRHLAVLGNTGSGKSCSVAGLVRWSIEAVKNGAKSGARFIILDPNGEYSASFSDLPNVQVFSASNADGSQIKQLTVPIWLWNIDEWTAFAKASVKTQKPLLIEALKIARNPNIVEEHDYEIPSTKSYFSNVKEIISESINAGDPYGRKGRAKGFLNQVDALEKSLNIEKYYNNNQVEAVKRLAQSITDLKKNNSGTVDFPCFDKDHTEALKQELSSVCATFSNETTESSIIEEKFHYFERNDLLRSLRYCSEFMKNGDYVSTMLTRIETLLDDSKLKQVINSKEKSYEDWVDKYLIPKDEKEGRVTVIDLSSLPSEIVHIIASVIARITLEELQKYREKNNGKTKPTVIVMEEAHTFITKYSEDDDHVSAYGNCTRVFEKIAREGRKYGLGLVISSQRPSELSPTVLSQCNTFLLHRISNDIDQALVNKLVPDNLKGLLRELPLLPPRDAILLGWASELPTLVRIKELDEKYRPKSDDPEFWSSWE